MSSAGTTGTRSAVGRADLLRALAVAPRDALALDIDESAWFGYVRQEEPGPPPRIETIGPPQQVPGSMPTHERRLPLRMPYAFAVVRRERRPPPESETETERVIREPIDAASAEPESKARRIDYADLVPQARLLPALRRQLGATRRGPLDLERIAEGLAAGRIPRRLPRRILRRWHPELVVVLDFSPRLWPYRADMHRLAERLLRHCGRVSLRIFNHGPFGPWTDWLKHQNPNAEDEPPERDWEMPPPGAPVLIASDLGLLLGRGSSPAKAWVRFVKALKYAQVRPLALAPLGAQQLDGTLALPVLRWSPDAPAHPARGHGEAQAEPDGLNELFAMVAAARRIDPPLLRAMRKLNPVAPLDAGLEGAVWCHGDVDAGFTAALRTESQTPHLDRFHRQLPDLHARLEALRREHHAHLPISLAHEETLLWWDHAANQAKETAEARQRFEDAIAFMERLVATVTAPAGVPRAAGDWTAVAQGILRRAGGTSMPNRHRVLHELASAVRAVRGDAAVPGWVDPTVMAKARGEGSPLPCWLIQDAAPGWLRLQAQPAGPRQIALGEALAVDGGGVRVTGDGADGGRWLSAEEMPADLSPLDRPVPLRLETATEVLEVAAVRRPRGAGAWRCGRDGIEVLSPPFAGHRARWQGESLLAVLRPDAPPDMIALAAADVIQLKGAERAATVAFGIDARFGVYADLTIAAKHANATQRLRWIPPGTFRMGSPQTEAVRDDNEGPPHEVTISNGFWLFDTPCTQALWQAVMGDNPSYFKSPDRPVEQVSWDDVQGFLERINQLAPGLDLVLPTEAEWEHACRAGTETAIYSGDLDIMGECNAPALDPIAWYGGNSGVDFDLDNGVDSADWPNKQYPHSRAGTRPVALKQPNAWGLYDMLGNVWEWCLDGRRTYGSAEVTDPVGPSERGAPRVLRGGSWSSLAQIVRSAYRLAHVPGLRFNYSGFRCARVQESREPASGPEAREEKKRRGRSKPPEAAA